MSLGSCSASGVNAKRFGEFHASFIFLEADVEDTFLLDALVFIQVLALNHSTIVLLKYQTSTSPSAT